MDTPLLVIVGGPNGVGKSTFTAHYLRETAPDLVAVNPDDIAREIDPNMPEAVAVSASAEAVRRMRGLLAARTSFLVETTLSGAFHLRLATQAKAEGWQVELRYIFVERPEISLHRIRGRVAAGGHDVTRSDVERRFPRSAANLFVMIDIADRAAIYENSGAEFVTVAAHDRHGWRIFDPVAYGRLKEIAET